jgi:hypothetical protein
MTDDCGMANLLTTANLILWMGTLPLGIAILSSVLRLRPALVPSRHSGGRARGCW